MLVTPDFTLIKECKVYLILIYGNITNWQLDQLPVGVTALLLEHRTSIQEVMGSIIIFLSILVASAVYINMIIYIVFKGFILLTELFFRECSCQEKKLMKNGCLQVSLALSRI